MGIISRANRIVSLNEFSDDTTPIELSKIDVQCPYDDQYILRMPVCVNGKDFYCPVELLWLAPLFETAYKHQIEVLKVKHSFCYITVRHGIVKSVLDDEWHVDGFSTKITHIPEQNYIWSNINGTEYCDVSTEFPDDFDPMVHNVNSYLAKFVEESDIKTCNPKTMYCLDPYVLHRRPTASSGQKRTFVRISFVPIEIRDVNNTHNPIMPEVEQTNGIEIRNKLIHY